MDHFKQACFPCPDRRAPRHRGPASSSGKTTRHDRDRGFTLVELLIVTVMLTLIAAIVGHKAAAIKNKAALAVLESDLRNVVIAQEVYHAEKGTYFNDAPDLGTADALTAALTPKLGFNTSPKTKLTIRGNKTGWTARANHKGKAGLKCAVFIGDIVPLQPATEEGVIACEPKGKKKAKKAKKPKKPNQQPAGDDGAGDDGGADG